MTDKKEPESIVEAVIQHNETQQLANALSKKITVDALLDKAIITDADIRKQYVQELSAEFPQIPQETLEKLLNVARVAIDPGVENGKMMIDGKMYDINPKVRLETNPEPDIKHHQWGHTGYLIFHDEDGYPLINPHRSDVKMDWPETLLDPNRRLGGGLTREELVPFVAGQPTFFSSDRMLANKHRSFYDEEFISGEGLKRAQEYTDRKIAQHGLHGRLRGVGFGGHVDDGEGITYFLPRDYQKPLIDSITDMGTRKIQNASLRWPRFDNVGSIGHVSRPLPFKSHDGYALTVGYLRMNRLTARMGLTRVVADPVITLRHNREYGHSHYTVVAPVDAGEFYDSRIPHHRRHAFAIDIESNIASRALLPKVTPRNKGPKKRRHK